MLKTYDTDLFILGFSYLVANGTSISTQKIPTEFFIYDFPFFKNISRIIRKIYADFVWKNLAGRIWFFDSNIKGGGLDRLMHHENSTFLVEEREIKREVW